jgi:hypothetical protein
VQSLVVFDKLQPLGKFSVLAGIHILENSII